MGKESQKRRKDVIYIDLTMQFPPEADFQFLRAELPGGMTKHFLARVVYALCGDESSTGLVIDLDKRIFLDNFEGMPDIEKIAQKSAPLVASYISLKLDKKSLQKKNE